jgi:hypothetical protein
VVRNRALCLVQAVLLSAACGKSLQSRTSERSDGTGPVPADPAGSASANTKGPTQMAATEPDTAIVQGAIAKEIKISADDVKVRPLKVSVPGITVFTASVNPAKAGRSVTRTGIVQGGSIYVETEAMSRVARAWDYGAKRTVPATTVAQVFGALHNATAESSPFIDDDTVQTYKKVSGPKRAAAVAMPVEATIDGHPAVVYCLTSSSRGTPFSVITAIVKPDFKVEIRAQPILED